ncbi:MAG: hypothetical protein ABIP49_00065, partial [Lysobacterales bacterium]
MSAGIVLAGCAIPLEAAQVDIAGPAGSSVFGTSVTVLPNGNIVVTDPFASVPTTNAGAVHLYSPTGVLISSLTGSGIDNRVGSGGIVVLSNGHFVVRSPRFDLPGFSNVGAVTWVNGSTGLNGVVAIGNSLLGGSANDLVGDGSVTALNNGHFVVASPNWDNGGQTDAGAVTWVNGSSGLAAAVSASNSLVGTSSQDRIAFGSAGVTALGNGNYVVASPFWDGAGVADAGAATFANGATGRSGVVSASNSLVGTRLNDRVAVGGVVALGSSNYVVVSSTWDSASAADVGAVTWGNGVTGIVGAVTTANSLTGTTLIDQVGSGGVRALVGNHYVVVSPVWDNGATANVGAVTWGNGSSGRVGPVLVGNSLIGSTAEDRVGDFGVTALSNGHYVVASSMWDNGASADAGAATWGNGTTGISGAVTAANSLIGTTFNDGVADKGVTALSNGNYVVSSAFWSNGGTSAVGAVTWANGASGLVGAVSTANSLIGRRVNDFVGSGGVTALGNGHYVVISPFWDNSPTNETGATTWVNGTAAATGMITPANSMAGATTLDVVGSGGVTALSNSNYVVSSPNWDNGITANVGAATWGNGATGTTGAIASNNSLVGGTADDFVSSNSITALANGYFAVASPSWDDVGVADAGAVTLGRGDGALSGPIVAGNSV